MAVKLKTIKMFSKKQNKEVDYSVETIKVKDEGGNDQEYISLKNGTEEHRYSPTFTDEELQKVVADKENNG